MPLIANGFMDKARQQAAFNIQQHGEHPCSATRDAAAGHLHLHASPADEYPHLLEQDNHKVRDRISW